MTLVAYFFRDWKHVHLLSTLPWAVFFIFYLVFVPESPQWLLTKQKMEQAEHALANYARWNNKPKLNRKEIEALSSHSKPEHRSSFFSIFKSKILGPRLLIVWFAWLGSNIIFYGMIWNSGTLSGNLHVNFILNILVEIPSFLLAPVVMKKLGRKASLCGSCFIGGAVSIASIFLVLYTNPETNRYSYWGLTALLLVGKCLSSLIFILIELYTPELFPTFARSTAQGTSSTMATVGALLAPYIAELPTYTKTPLGSSFPQLVFGGVGIVTGLLCLRLPETRHVKHLPDTIKEAKDLSRKRKMKQEQEKERESPNVGGERGSNHTAGSREENDTLLL